jgi:hypothetical protein
MNEHLLVARIRQALDESAERLPYRVTQRLERARHAAVLHASAAAITVPAASGGATTVSLPNDNRPSALVRLLSTLAPVLLIIAGLYGIAAWDDAQRAADTTDIDAEIVLSEDDDVPLSALTDRGFGVYIKNSRQ